MEKDTKCRLHYFNSHGTSVVYVGKVHGQTTFKVRKFRYVLPEVEEIIHRKKKRYCKNVSIPEVCLELNVAPKVVSAIFTYFVYKKILNKTNSSFIFEII